MKRREVWIIYTWGSWTVCVGWGWRGVGVGGMEWGYFLSITCDLCSGPLWFYTFLIRASCTAIVHSYKSPFHLILEGFLVSPVIYAQVLCDYIELCLYFHIKEGPAFKIIILHFAMPSCSYWFCLGVFLGISADRPWVIYFHILIDISHWFVSW